MYRPRANAEDELCPLCQVAYDTQPLGVLVRRWSAEFADIDGRQSGLLCDKCKATVRARHDRVSHAGLLFHFANPNQDSRPAEPGAAAAFARMSAEEQAARRSLHEQEVQERLSWCLRHALTPAHEHIHLAPGNNTNFMVRDPPVYRITLTQYCDAEDEFMAFSVSFIVGSRDPNL